MPGTKNSRDLQLVDVILTNIARAYKPQGLIYNEVLPTIPVVEDSGKYMVFDGFFDDDTDNKVSDRALTPEIDTNWSTDTYYCEDYRLKVTVTEKELRNVHSAVRLRQTKTEALLMRMALRRERRAAALLRKTTNGGGLNLGAAPSVNWDQSTATIEVDIKTGAMAVRDVIGMTTNTIVIPYKVAYEMAMQEDIRALLRWDVTGRPQNVLELGDRLLPNVIHGHRVIIPGAMYNTAGEGGTKSLSDIWGDHVRLLYIAPGGGGWGVPSVGYSFKALPEVVDRWKDNDPPVESIRAWECVDEKITAPDAGYELASVLS